MNKYFAIIIGLVLQGCSLGNFDKYKDFIIPVNSSIPVGSMELGDELFLNQIPEENLTDDDIITTTQEFDIDILSASDINNLLVFPDQDISFNIDVPFAAPMKNSSSATGSNIVTIPIDMDPIVVRIAFADGTTISNIELAIAKFLLSSTGTSPHIDLSDVTITIPEIVKHDDTLLKIKIGDDKTRYHHTITLNETGDITIIVSGNISVDVSALPVDNTIPLSLQFKIITAALSNAEGFFGRHVLPTTAHKIIIATETFNFLATVEDFYLSNPSFITNIKTSIDMPVLLVLNYFKINGVEVDIHRNAYGLDRFLIANSLESNFNIGNESFYNDLLSNYISRDEFEVEMSFTPIVNPTQEELYTDKVVVSKKNTINLSKTELTGAVVFKIPIEGYIKNFQYDHSLNFELNIQQEEIVKEVSLVVMAENYFPMDISLDLYAENEFGKVELLQKDLIRIASSLNNVNPKSGLMKPSIIDENNFKIITLDAADAVLLFSASKLIFRIKAISKDAADNRYIALYRGSKLKFSMSVGVKAELSTDFENDYANTFSSESK